MLFLRAFELFFDVCVLPLGAGIEATHGLLNEMHLVVRVDQDERMGTTPIAVLGDVHIECAQAFAPAGRTSLQFRIRPEFVFIFKQLQQLGAQSLHIRLAEFLYNLLELLAAVLHLFEWTLGQTVAESIALPLLEGQQRGRHVTQQLDLSRLPVRAKKEK